MVKKCKSCDGRKSHHSEEIKSSLTSRLNRIEGQIRGISRMIGEDVYCDDILNQISSINSALNGVSKILLDEHIKSCVSDKLTQGDTEVVPELIKTIGRMMK